MGLADIKGDKAFDVFAEIMEPIINISMDEEVKGLFEVTEVPEGVDREKFAMERVKKYFPILLKKHKNDLIVILAALEGKSAREYKKNLSVPGIFQSVNGLLVDPTFRAFLS